MTIQSSPQSPIPIGSIISDKYRVERIVGKWKVSQNRTERDRNNVVQELQKRGEHTISAAMAAVKN